MNCEMEDGDIRYINKELRKTLKGYKKSEDRLETYKGHKIKNYNLKWLRKQSKEVKAQILKELDFNLAIAKMENGKIKEAKTCEFDMSDTLEIPLVPNEIEREEER